MTLTGSVRWLSRGHAVLRRWLTSEIVRGVLAVFVGTPVGIWITDPFFVQADEVPQAMASMFGGWAGLTASHALMTWWAFRGRMGDDLRESLKVGEAWERHRPWWWWLGTDGPMWSISIAATALAAVGLLLALGKARGVPMLLTAGVLTLASWLDVMITFAALYARLDMGRDGPMLQFPDDDRPRIFSDYVYLGVTVMATFGASDTAVCHPRMRRQVAAHAVIAFLFNTMIVAVLVSLVTSLTD